MIACGDCGSPMVLRNSRFGQFYGCTKFPACKGTHGAHPDGKPMGIPANKETKEARITAHAAFDTLWKTNLMKRKEAYRWMRRAMDLPAKMAHISMFSKEQCALLCALIKARESK